MDARQGFHTEIGSAMEDPAPRMTVSEYAKSRHITPQNVHYYIRQGRVQKHKCDCGRFVVDVHEADLAMGFKKEVPDGGTEDVPPAR